MTSKIRLVILFGGQSAEHDVSCTSARHVIGAIDQSKYDIETIGITRTGEWVRAEAATAALYDNNASLPDALAVVGPAVDPIPALCSPPRSDAHDVETTVVFPLLHGPMGEDGTVQGLLELAGVPFVGTGVLGSAMCMDKIVAKNAAAHAGLPQPRYRGLHADTIASRSSEVEAERSDQLGLVEADLVAELGLPMFVKPANLGSSVGVSKVSETDDLVAALRLAATFDEWIIVEEGIVDALEIEVAVIGNLSKRASVAGQVIPAAEFYDYDDKYGPDAQTLVPADLSPEVHAEAAELAVRAAEVLRVEGLARVDFFYEPHGRGLLLNEINTMPGFTPTSMYPKLWAESPSAVALSYPELIDELVQHAIERFDRRRRHRRADSGAERATLKPADGAHPA